MEDIQQQQQQVTSEENTLPCSPAFTEDQEVDLRQDLKHDYNSPYEFLRWDDEDTQEMVLNSNSNDDRDFGNMYSGQCGNSSKGAAGGNTIESENFSGPFSPGYGGGNINDSDAFGIDERNQSSCLQDKQNVCSSEDHGGMRNNEGDKQDNHNVRAEVMIQQDKVGLIIGRGGRTIKALQEKTRTKMHIVQINSSFHNASSSPVNSNSLSKTLVIIGTQDAILHAEQLVYDLISKATTSSSPSERSANSSPSHYNSPSGSNSKHENYSNSSGGGGPQDSLGSGRKYSSANNNNIVHSRSGNFNNSNPGNKSQKIKTIRFPVPKISVGLIIGKGGETIKKIRMETGAKVQFNPLNTNTSVGEKDEQIAIITGTHEQIRYACDLIEELIDTALNCGEKYNNNKNRNAADDSSGSWSDEISYGNAQSSSQSQFDCTKQYQYVQDSHHPSTVGSFPIQHDHANTFCSSGSNSRNDIMIEESSGNIGGDRDRIRLVGRKEKKTIRNMNQCSGSSAGHCDGGGQLAESSNTAGLDNSGNGNGSSFDTARGYGAHQVKHGKEQHFSKNSRNNTASDKPNKNRDHFCPNPNYQMSTDAHSQLFSLGNGHTNLRNNNVQPGTVEWGQGDQNTQWGTYNELPYSEPTQIGHQECYMHLPTQVGVGSDYSQWVQYPRQSSDPGPGYNAQDLKATTIPPVPIMSATIVQNPGDPVNLMAPPAIYFSLPPIHSPNNLSPKTSPDHQSGHGFDHPNNANNCENQHGAEISQERVENENNNNNNGLYKVENSSYSSATVENTSNNYDSNNFEVIIDTQKLPEENLFQPATSSAGLDSCQDSFNLDNSSAGTGSEAKDPRELHHQEQFINQKFDNNAAAPGFASQPFTVIYPQNTSGSGPGPDNSGQASNIGTPGSCTRIVSFYYDLNVNSIVIMNQWHYY